VNWSALAIAGAVTLIAAAAGNVLIPKQALAWFRSLRWPSWLVPYAVFIVVGVIYYVVMATVLYRALDRRASAAAVWAIVLIAANEGWNVIFFGRRSTIGGFIGILAFAALLTGLIISIRDDGLSVLILAGYAAWVAYDIAWTFALWRANPTNPRP
jgi:tryptophan-rich sensory protein